jgi:hypothetical protein
MNAAARGLLRSVGLTSARGGESDQGHRREAELEEAERHGGERRGAGRGFQPRGALPAVAGLTPLVRRAGGGRLGLAGRGDHGQEPAGRQENRYQPDDPSHAAALPRLLSRLHRCLPRRRGPCQREGGNRRAGRRYGEGCSSATRLETEGYGDDPAAGASRRCGVWAPRFGPLRCPEATRGLGDSSPGRISTTGTPAIASRRGARRGPSGLLQAVLRPRFESVLPR